MTTTPCSGKSRNNPTNTINNFTYYNHTCWWTDENGIANVETWWDMQEVKFRIGPFAYYFESAEWEDNNNYKGKVLVSGFWTP